jgi:hypothetical protein
MIHQRRLCVIMLPLPLHGVAPSMPRPTRDGTPVPTESGDGILEAITINSHCVRGMVATTLIFGSHQPIKVALTVC